MIPVFWRNDFTTPSPIPSTMRASVQRYSKANWGGADVAQLEFVGHERALVDLRKWLRYSCELQATSGPRGRKVWRGYVHSVRLQLGALSRTWSLDGAANHVRVAYTIADSTGHVRATTAAAFNADSIARYGQKEILYPMSYGGSAQAERMRDAILAESLPPINGWDAFGDGDGVKVTMMLRGLWHLFDWRTWSGLVDNVVVKYIAEPEDATFDIGSSAANTKVAQSYTYTSVANSRHIPTTTRFKLVKVGNPTDSLILDHCADAAGVPGSVLATGEIAGSGLTNSHAWYELTSSGSGTILQGTNTHLQLRRTGAPDAVNFYRVIANTAAGYAGGSARIWNGSAWVAQSADLLFEARHQAVRTTTEQIQDIYNGAGQLLGGLEIELDSGVYAPTARSGDATARRVLEDLLGALTATGRRITAQITPQRRMRVSLEPLPGENDIYVTRDRKISTRYNTPIQAFDCPVGVWARMKDALLGEEDQAVFLDHAEYSVVNDRYTPTARKQGRAFDMGVVIA